MSSKGITERMHVNPDSLYYREHVARYEFARNYINDGPILDIASGTGYGSELLHSSCRAMVVGVDVDWPSLKAARRTYANPRITFLAASGTHLPFRDTSFAAIVSLETIEHIQEDRTFLSELRRVLRPDGICVISTPNRLYSLHHNITNPYHVREYIETELVELLSSVFESIEVFYQGFATTYHAEVKTYAESIQSQKKQLHPLLRWGIDHIYRPLKRLIPSSVVNYFIRKLLGLSYPQPHVADITISKQPVPDFSNFVVVCRKTNN